MEAGEYLGRLASLASGPGAPALDEFVRFTRALRGSALMASQHAIGRTASGLEAVARALRDGRRAWEPELARTVSDAIGRMREYLKRVPNWTDHDTMEAEQLGRILDELAGVSSGIRTTGLAAPGEQPDTGVRAFVAREAASIASLLDRAASNLRADPGSHEQVHPVIQRMRPLRGLAALSDFPPLAELLEALELVIVELGREEIPADRGPALLDAGARALSSCAREVVESGRPSPEADEVRGFATLLRGARLGDGAIVPIASLFYGDGQPGMLQAGQPPEPVGPAPSRGELISRGARLCQIADELVRSGATTQRELRLQSISRDLGALPGGVRGELGSRLHAFADTALASIARGAAALDPQAFSDRLREAGDLLRNLADATSESTRLTRLSEITLAILPAVQHAVEPAEAAGAEPVAAAVDDESDVVPIESLLYHEAPAATAVFAEPPTVSIESLAPGLPVEAPQIVPIETLLLAEAGTAPVPAPVAPAPAAPLVATEVAALVTLEAGEGNDIAGSFVTYARLVRDLGLGTPMLEALTKGTPARLEPVGAAAREPVAPPPPAPSVAPATAPAPVGIVAPALVEPEAVPIAELCYQGRAALNRAAEVRRQIHRARSERALAHTIQPLVDELIDLVGLALTD
jgi:hypothetical protein